MKTSKHFLFIFRQAPHSNLSTKEGMDFAFACAAFEQKVDAYFSDDGVYQLLKNQDTQALGIKNHSAAIEAFELYGIMHCYYDASSLKQRKLDVDELIDSAIKQNDDFLENIHQYDYVFSY